MTAAQDGGAGAQWFYAVGTERQGPVDEATLLVLARAGTVLATTLVWRSGMPDWRPLAATELGRRKDVMAEPLPYVEGRQHESRWTLAQGAQRPSYRAEDLDRLFVRYWLMLIPLVIGYGTAIVAALGGVTPVAILGGAVCLAGLAGFITFFCKLFHRMWEQVQDGNARWAPAHATALQCVPLVNFVWSFFAVWGLAKELNRVMTRWHVPGPRAPEGLALAFCIVHCGMYCQGLITLAGLVLGIILLVQLKASAKAVLAFRLAGADGVPEPARA